MARVSRRRFLGSAAAVPLALRASIPIPPGTHELQRPAQGDQRRPNCLLVDAGDHCVLKESLAGYARGLEAAAVPFRQVNLDKIEPAKLLIVPGALMHSAAFAAALRGAAERGNRVLYESGAAYAEEKQFENERSFLETQFGFTLKHPI